MDYNKMSFEDLFDAVFTGDGEIKACGRDACRGMIRRLEDRFHRPGCFGDSATGRLKMPTAFDCASTILKDRQE